MGPSGLELAPASQMGASGQGFAPALQMGALVLNLGNLRVWIYLPTYVHLSAPSVQLLTESLRTYVRVLGFAYGLGFERGNFVNCGSNHI